MKRVILVLCVLSLLVTFTPASAASSYSAEEVWSKIHSSNQPLLIDVRDNTSYIAGHIPTAINFPLSEGVDEQTATSIQNYGKSEVITYCSCVDGHFAKVFIEVLEANFSFTNAFYMHDDFRYWPYDAVNGSDAGTVIISQETSNGGVNDSGSELTYFFIIINVLLFGLVVLLVYRKRNK